MSGKLKENKNSEILIHGARQHNLKNIDVSIPLNQLTIITGPSGSGKSSLAFHTLYAEGQRRYVETFSPYVRQFMDRMDKPAVNRIDGIPPAIAIEQKNTIRTTRSTVGTLTELNDYLKVLYPHLARAYDPNTGDEIKPDNSESIVNWCSDNLIDSQISVLFPITISSKKEPSDILSILNQQGFTRIWQEGKVIRTDSKSEMIKGSKVFVIQDRLKFSNRNKIRLAEAIEHALQLGHSHCSILDHDGKLHHFSSLWINPKTGFTLTPPSPSLFSFNSPLGACDHCRGFGKTIGTDVTKAIPNPNLSIAEGCVQPFTTARGEECQRDLLHSAKDAGIDIHTPFRDLLPHEQQWLLEGERDDPEEAWQAGEWYGIRGFFNWLESKSYKMHVRVFLSRYRAYTTCPKCNGTRLQPHSLCYKIAGKTLPDLWQMPISELRIWFKKSLTKAQKNSSTSISHALEEITSRVDYLCEVGLSYLTLDRAANTLSGGEIERVNLTTCLGAALTNTMFVLDEPTVGLHQRDIKQLIKVMQNLRDKGNTVVVVEHEESVMRAADHLIDVGPAAGEHGGEIVYAGSLKGISKKEISKVSASSTSQTLPFLSGKKSISFPKNRRSSKKHLSITGATKHNLKNLDVSIPLGIFTCITGVSGSGKSTLAQDVIYLNVAKELGIVIDETPASISSLRGTEHITSIERIDQSPLTRTPRSTPAVYSGAFESLRILFAKYSDASDRNLTPGYFSFNSGNGRCQRCLGNGFEKVEMQFLSDLYITCPECDGKRYTPEALAINYYGKSIADVLAMTVTEGIAFISQLEKTTAPEERLRKKFTTLLQPLVDVGLGYLRLGQPLNTLSGGESQRLKLCQLLQSSTTPEKKILILDEPTTGLHFIDIEKLLTIFHRLTDVGHTLLVIEHNLDVIKNADHLIEIGPSSGKDGGKIIFTGTPEEITKTNTPTAKAFSISSTSARNKKLQHQQASQNAISISGAREHNLKNISVEIPHNELAVVTGLSGSGKSTLAFDIVFAEGQRRFLDSMSPYARQFAGQLEKPDVDRITGLPPTVAIEQRVTRGGGKSTTGTVTEIYHFLRLLYAKLGIQHCPVSGEPVVSQTSSAIKTQIKKLQRKYNDLLILAPLIKARKGFHTDVAAAAAKKGIRQLLVDGKIMETEGFEPLKRFQTHDIFAICDSVEQALQLGKKTCAAIPASQISRYKSQITNFSTERVSPTTGKSFEELDPHHFSFNSHRGWCPDCRGYGTISKSTRYQKKDQFNSELEAEIHESLGAEEDAQEICPSCQGTRLREESRHVFIHNTPIYAINALSVTDAIALLSTWKFTGREKIIARDILPEIIQRLQFLEQVGLGYLQLDRSANTLSGGESQRIRLAAQLGSNLRGVLYVLDEPTIGLHPRDNVKLLDTLESLRERGNSLLVVEHDDETISRASKLIELGPGAGSEGGQLSPIKKLESHFSGKRRPRRPIPKVNARSGWLKIKGCSANNLKNIDTRIPLGRLTVLTGVSGCGKSSLMRGCLAEAAKSKGKKKVSDTFKSATGFENIKNTYEVDQSPIGKTSRSCPATYVKLLDNIRQLFAQLPESRARGYTASRFSFNNKEGQCPKCKGNGRIKLEMDFLPTTWVDCESCRGMRYNQATLEVTFNQKNIGEVLQMSIREAKDFFSSQPKLHRTLKLLDETGLGYLQLGQPSPTLSGGEAQRIKLVSELTKGRKKITDIGKSNHNLYLIEEPSIGLHENDVENLIGILHRLVEEGHTVVVIEHHTTIMAEADYIIDIGPEAGAKGGKIVTQATPEHVARSKTSRTAPFLAKALKSGV